VTFVFFLALSRASASTCDGSSYEVSVSGVQYCGFEIHVTFQQAVQYCEGIGAFLLDIQDAHENGIVQSVAQSVQGDVWIGYNDIAAEGDFEWVNGNPTTFSNWGPGEPSASQSNDDCTKFSANTGTWYDAPCHDSFRFICKDECLDDPLKSSPGVCGCGTPDVDTDGDGIIDCEPLFHSEVQRWLRARNECRSRGGDLAMPSTAARALELSQLAVDQGAQVGMPVWVGAKDKGIGLMWGGQLNIQLPAEAYLGGAPPATSERFQPNMCLTINAGATSVDQLEANSIPCHEAFPFICDGTSPSAVPTANPTATSTASPTTAAPTASPSTAATTASPTTATPKSGCCTYDYKTCSTTDPNNYCNSSQANCENGCSGTYMYDLPRTCIALWGECTNNVGGCCSPSTCQGDQWYKQCLD